MKRKKLNHAMDSIGKRLALTLVDVIIEAIANKAKEKLSDVSRPSYTKIDKLETKLADDGIIAGFGAVSIGTPQIEANISSNYEEQLRAMSNQKSTPVVIDGKINASYIEPQECRVMYCENKTTRGVCEECEAMASAALAAHKASGHK